MSIRSKLIAAILTAGALGLFANAHAYTGQQYAKWAKISLPQAKMIALKTFPGKVVSLELEKEKGGSGLRYSFDIRQGKLVHEVGVDAKTGKVLENFDDSHDSD